MLLLQGDPFICLQGGYKRVTKVLIDMVHPAHALVFRHTISELKKAGHEVLVMSRDKDVLLEFLGQFGIEHRIASTRRTGRLGLFYEMLVRDIAIIKTARRFNADVMIGCGGVATSQAGRLCGIPAISFYDNETAILQNMLSHSFSRHVFVPEFYEGWLPKGRHTRFAGFKELAYLHPNRFTLDRQRAIAAGLDPERDNFFIRIVAWNANHDWGRKGWSGPMLKHIVQKLSERGKVHLSSEVSLDGCELAGLQFKGSQEDFHHLVGHCRLLVGESCTMAAEAAVLGCPAVYAAPQPSCTVRELADRYGLVSYVSAEEEAAVEAAMWAMLEHSPEFYQQKRTQMLQDKIDVTAYIVQKLLHYAKTR